MAGHYYGHYITGDNQCFHDVPCENCSRREASSPCDCRGAVNGIQEHPPSLYTSSSIPASGLAES